MKIYHYDNSGYLTWEGEAATSPLDGEPMIPVFATDISPYTINVDPMKTYRYRFTDLKEWIAEEVQLPRVPRPFMKQAYVLQVIMSKKMDDAAAIATDEMLLLQYKAQLSSIGQDLIKDQSTWVFTQDELAALFPAFAI